jgi:hypothetical protein
MLAVVMMPPACWRRLHSTARGDATSAGEPSAVLMPGERPADHVRYQPLDDRSATVLLEILAMCLGGLATAAVMQFYRGRRTGHDADAWVIVGNMNTLLRLDLDHLTGDDDNHGLRELRVELKEAAAKRPELERKLLEHYNALVGVAITFGEKVHDEHGVIDMRAVGNRRNHVQNALAVGDQIEAALGGIAELAKCGNRDRSERVRESYHRVAIKTA